MCIEPYPGTRAPCIPLSPEAARRPARRLRMHRPDGRGRWKAFPIVLKLMGSAPLSAVWAFGAFDVIKTEIGIRQTTGLFRLIGHQCSFPVFKALFYSSFRYLPDKYNTPRVKPALLRNTVECTSRFPSSPLESRNRPSTSAPIMILSMIFILFILQLFLCLTWYNLKTANVTDHFPNYRESACPCVISL